MRDILDCRVLIDQDAMDTRVGQETVILHMEKAIYFGLDEVGTLIWEQLKSGRDLAEIIDAIVSQYGEDRGMVESDLRTFLEEMRENGLIRLS